MDAKGLVRWFAAEVSDDRSGDNCEDAVSPIHSWGAYKKKTHVVLREYLGRSLPLSHLLSTHLLSPDITQRLGRNRPLELRVDAVRLHPTCDRPKSRAAAMRPISRTHQDHTYSQEHTKSQPIRFRRKPSIRAKTASTQQRRRDSSMRVPLSKLKVISLKDACRDLSWVSTGKEAIRREFARMVNCSNGVTAVQPASLETGYRYYIGPGNNGALVDSLLKSRKWWTRVKSIPESQFVWSQRKEPTILSTLPKTAVRRDSEISGPTPFVCPVRFRAEGSREVNVVDVTALRIELITMSQSYRTLPVSLEINSVTLRTHNKLECNYNLANKKALYLNMKMYYSAKGMNYLDFMPLTFHITFGETDPEYARFEAAFRMFEERKRKAKWGRSADLEFPYNLWIIKPGENSNQGRDITLATMIEHVKTEIRRTVCPRTGRPRTYIVQKYIEKPFLYKKRKFDIRCYSMVTSVNGVIQGYYYPEGYIRTSCKEFDPKSSWDKYVHLTNDAVQKHSEEYGKHETGNKLTYSDFTRYMEQRSSELAEIFEKKVLPCIREIVKDTMMATFMKIDPNRRSPTFEVFGYDFMLDCDLKPYLIEVNTNPCLELTSPPLLKVIPYMLEGAFRIFLDSLFPEPAGMGRKGGESLPENRWELVFSEAVDGVRLIEELTEKGTVQAILEEDRTLHLLSDDEDLHSDSSVGD